MEVHVTDSRWRRDGPKDAVWDVNIKGNHHLEDLLKFTSLVEAFRDTFIVCEPEKHVFEDWFYDILSTPDLNICVVSINTNEQIFAGWENEEVAKARIEKLKLIMTNATSIPRSLLDVLAHNRHIHSLEVACHSENDWNALANMLLHNPTIVSIDILRSEKEQAKSVFFSAIAKNQTLKRLRIQSCPISVDDMKCLNDGLAINTTLEDLELENDITNTIALLPNSTLRGLKYNLFASNEEYERFYAALLFNQNLTRLELCERGQNVASIEKFVRQSQELKILSFKAYGVDSMERLTPVLENHPSITDLTLLARDQFYTTCFATRVLQVNKKIKNLTITGYLTPTTVSSICQSLYQNDTLTHLTLDASGFNELINLNPNSQFFSKLITKNKTLQVLSVTGMPLKDLKRLLTIKSALISLTVGCTNASKEVQSKHIEAALQKNFQLRYFKVKNKKCYESITRNRNLYVDAAIIVHSIKRSDLLLPIEIWTYIFALLGYPYTEHWMNG